MMAIISSALIGVGTALFVWLVKSAILAWYRERNHKEARSIAMENGLCAILRDSLIGKCEAYCERGVITTHGMQNIDLMYEAYHNLGGNGVVTSLYKKIKELPIEE